ncbi:MAG: XisH family protein [Bacteroidota bacterium]
MPAKDLYHDIVRIALEKDGWTVTNDPYKLKVRDSEYDVDLGAEKLFAATRGPEKIVVEVKSFLRQSKTYELHQALGQFNTYSFGLTKQEPDRKLFLAVPDLIYEDFFQILFIQDLIQHYRLKIVTFNIDDESITEWIEF